MTAKMNIHGRQLDFESKSLAELGNTAFLIQRSQDEFTQSIAAANLKIKQTEKELEAKEIAMQLERTVVEKLQLSIAEQNKVRDSLLVELEVLHKRLVDVEHDLSNKNQKISSAQQQVKTLEADSTNLREQVKKEKTNLPQLLSAREDLVSILAKVQAVIEAKSVAQQTLSSDELIVKHQLFMNTLMGQPSQEPSSESPIVATMVHENTSSRAAAATDETAGNCNSKTNLARMKNIPSILYASSSYSSSSAAATEHGEQSTSTLVQVKRLQSSEEYEQSKSRKRHASSTNKKTEDVRSHHDAQETRAELERLAPQIRAIFQKIHNEAKTTVRMEKIKCIRKEDGQWCVPDKERAAYSITGCQGRRTPEQGFNVRVHNQVISQKLLDTGLSDDSEYVEAVYEDPRDATAAYHLVFKLLN